MREDYEEQEKEVNAVIKKLQDERAEQENGVTLKIRFW